MRIGIDIDGTICESEWFLDILNNKFKTNISIRELTNINIKEKLNIGKDTFDRWIKDNENVIYGQAPIIKDVKKVLSELNKEHKLYFITARKKNLCNLTYSWFQKNDIPYTCIEFVGNNNKDEYIKKYSIDIFIEDNFKNAVNISNNNNIPVLIINMPYNQGNLDNNMYRVMDWTEIYNWINQYDKRSK